MKRVLFITTSNLTTNPRLHKEVKVASEKYHCEVICFRLGNWSDRIDQEHVKSLPGVNVRYISAFRKPYIPWLISSLIERLARKISPFFNKRLFLIAVASNKRTWLLMSAIRKVNERPDLIIAHNLGALYPASRLARRYNTKFAFDIEDYHPGEKIGYDAENEKGRREHLLIELLPLASYVSYASPLIGDQTLNLLSSPFSNPHFYLANSFSDKEFVKPSRKAENSSLKLVWFSQNITFERGLEQLLEALEDINPALYSLTLIGNLNPVFNQKILSNYTNVEVLLPIPQSELHISLADYDIGLALEIGSVDLNKDMAISNKIYAYAQAGLYILATNTKGQEWFINQYPKSGILVEQSADLIRRTLLQLITSKQCLSSGLEERFEIAKKMNWENESEKFISILNQALNIMRNNRDVY
jgi:hypothetical protein